MEYIHSVKHRVWGWPAVANFVMGGMAAGFYLLCFWDIWLRGGIAFSDPQAMTFTLLSPLLIVLGFLFMTFEAGRPLRGLYLLSNLKSSWMSREVLSGTAFALSAVITWLFPHILLLALSAGFGIAYLVSQGYMVYRSRAVTAWNVPLAPILFLMSGVVSGYGLLLIVAGLSGLMISIQMVLSGLVCLALNLLVYGFYALLPRRDSAFQAATAILRNPVSFIAVLGMGHLVPGIMLILFLSSSGFPMIVGTYVQDALLVLAGCFIVGGGAFQKILVILGANSLRGIIMGQPQSRSLC